MGIRSPLIWAGRIETAMYKIVIIDDEKWVVKSLRAMLQGQGAFSVVGEAYNGLQGWELIKKETPDLAFVDIRMPGLGGLQLIQKAYYAKCPTLFAIISGFSEFAYAQKAMQYSAIGYCLKPFSQSEINETIEKAKGLLAQRNQLDKPLQEIQPALEEEKPATTAPRGKTKNELVSLMLDYIDHHFCQNITVGKVAAVCGINDSYASQIFNREVGQSFSSYLSGKRIAKGIELLQTTNMPITTIAVEIGYKDYFYFSKVFKKYTGETPTACRERAQNEKREVKEL